MPSLAHSLALEAGEQPTSSTSRGTTSGRRRHHSRALLLPCAAPGRSSAPSRPAADCAD